MALPQMTGDRVQFSGKTKPKVKTEEKSSSLSRRKRMIGGISLLAVGLGTIAASILLKISVIGLPLSIVMDCIGGASMVGGIWMLAKKQKPSTATTPPEQPSADKKGILEPASISKEISPNAAEVTTAQPKGPSLSEMTLQDFLDDPAEILIESTKKEFYQSQGSAGPHVSFEFDSKGILKRSEKRPTHYSVLVKMNDVHAMDLKPTLVIFKYDKNPFTRSRKKIHQHLKGKPDMRFAIAVTLRGVEDGANRPSFEYYLITSPTEYPTLLQRKLVANFGRFHVVEGIQKAVQHGFKQAAENGIEPENSYEPPMQLTLTEFKEMLWDYIHKESTDKTRQELRIVNLIQDKSYCVDTKTGDYLDKDGEIVKSE